jgi:hypothetical protein
MAGCAFEEQLIAPCGMNCGVCANYLARKNDLNRQGFKRMYCEGCLPRGKSCLFMAGKCDKLGKGLVRFCFECADFPCKRLKALDKRYREKYHMSMIENLKAIQENGIEDFMKRESEKWRCADCGEMICCHNGLCLSCQTEFWKKNRKYRWGER